MNKLCCLVLELAFLETSALTGENVEEVFLKCTRTILTKIDAGKPGDEDVVRNHGVVCHE